eukprot:10499330-Ditylum_brightwellii.AAC.1
MHGRNGSIDRYFPHASSQPRSPNERFGMTADQQMHSSRYGGVFLKTHSCFSMTVFVESFHKEGKTTS